MKIKNYSLFFIIFLLFFLVRPVLAANITGNDLEVILDCSSSMSQPLGNLSKIEAAKKAVSESAQAIPDNKYFGFRAFGHRTLLDNKNAGCQDSELLIPISPVSKDTVALKIKNLSARGGAPIAYSLKQTRTDFSNNPEFGKVVVLISDGKDNCDADPCAAVKEMKNSGFNLIVNTISLAPSPEAESQMRCIAEASGGEFSKAYSYEELEKSLNVIFGKAYNQLSSTQNAAPGSSFTEAPSVPAGKFAGMLLPGEIKYYKFNAKKGQDVMATLSFKRETAIDPAKSKENLASCGWLQPSIKLYDQFQTLITGYTPGAESEKIVKDQDTSLKSYFVNWKAETTGDIYVAFSSQWLKACPTVAATQSREQFKKGLYEINVAIEGEAANDNVAASEKSEPSDQPQRLASPEKTTTETPVTKSKSGSGLWQMIMILVFFLGLIGGLFYLIKKKGLFGKKKHQGKITEAYDASTGNLKELSEKRLMESGPAGPDQEFFKSADEKSVGQTGQIKLNDYDAAYITCPGCQAKNLFGSRICTNCGKKL